MLLIFSKMLTIGLLLAVGALTYKLGMITPAGSKELSTLIVQVCIPILLVSNALADSDALTPQILGISLGVSALIYLALILLGHLLPRLIGAPREDYPSYLLISLFGNVGFIGIPVALSVLGSPAIPFVIVNNVVFNLLFYTYGEHTVAKYSGQNAAFDWKKMVNSGTVSCFIAILIYLLHLSLPEFFTQALVHISNATTFLSMLVLGVTLATTPAKTVLTNWRSYVFSLLRILVFPILLALVLRGFFPQEPVMVSALVIMAAMPGANSPVMLATRYGMNTDTMTSAIIVSTLMCLFTIPVVAMFFPA